jgi:cysteinyl-tRNA synthetase
VGCGYISIEEAQALCKQMDEAKKNKDYDTSDAIRKQILDAGYEVQQSPEGSSIKGKLA